MAAEYPGAMWAPSPNFTRGRRSPVTLVVIHITDGQPRVERCVERFQRPTTKKAPHFVVGRRGEVYQLVSIEDTAWHDAGRNAESVGIEHVARTPGELAPDDSGLALTEEQLDASALLVGWLLKRLKLDVASVVPHCSNPGSSHADCGRDVADGGIWPWPDYRARVEDKSKPGDE